VKKKSPALAIIIILLGLFFSISAFRDIFGVRQAALSIFFPFQYAATAVVNSVLDVPTSIGNLTRLNADNNRLKEEVKQLKLKQLGFDKLEQENKTLRQALRFQNLSPYRYKLTAAQIIGRAPAPWFSIVEINKGLSAGIKKGQAVVAPSGVVGRIIEVGQLTAKVALLTDPTSSVAAACYESGDFGVVVGRSNNKLNMKYVGSLGRIKEGSKIVTSSISKVFPPGILIGKVTRATKREHDLFFQIEVEPAIDFAKLSEVFVVVK